MAVWVLGECHDHGARESAYGVVHSGNMVLYVSLSIIGKLIPVLTCAGLLSPARHGTFLEDLDQGRWAGRMGEG